MTASDPPPEAARPSRAFRPLPVPQVDVRGFWGDRVDAVAVAHRRHPLRALRRGRHARPDRPGPAVARRRHPVPSSRRRLHRLDGDDADVLGFRLSARRSRPPPIRSTAAATRSSRRKIDAVIDMYEKLQQPDGYLSAWYQRIQPGLRWTNLRDCHELYCAGHLIEGAVAYFQATGKRKLLDVMCRYADHIADMFGPEPGKKQGYCGHEEIELALVKLARVDRRAEVSRPGEILHRPARPAAALLRRGGARARRRPEGLSISRPTNTTSRTSRCASRTRSSAMRCGRCTSIPAWPTSPPNMATTALRAALDRLWDDLTTKQPLRHRRHRPVGRQ